MKCTKKSVNACLDRLDYLKKIFAVPGTTGIDVDRYWTVGTCEACINSDGSCAAIYVNPRWERENTSRYYGACDITDIIVRWMSNPGDYTRKDAVADIAQACTQCYRETRDAKADERGE